MKTKLLLLVTFLCSTTIFSQSNEGWSQYAKPLYINQMVKDASGNYHYATNLGYQKLDGSFNTVEFINLTSHNTPLGNCFAVAVNPSNENQIALAENERLFIYTNGAETNQIEISPSTPFTGPSLYYNNNNALYIFDKYANTEGYSIFENGTLTDVITTGIRPQDIIENNDGTKVFIAGSNNGLWEYTKVTDTWVNYTMANSNLMSNFINDLFVDASDNLFAGTYQGISKLEPNGTITTCEPPTFYPVFELDTHPTTGEILARTSQPNSSNVYGFCTVDFNSCSWTNYTDTNTCFSTNMFKTVQFTTTPNDGQIVASGAQLSAENTYIFNPINPTDSCSSLELNYMGTPIRVDTNYIIDIEVRKKVDGKIDIGMCNGSEALYYVSVQPETFSGTFTSATEIPLPTGKSAFSIVKDNEHFIIENDEGWIFVDENDTISEFNHSIPNYLSIVTKKAAKFDSDNGIITLIHKGFDTSFNYRVYKTICNTTTGTCSASEEIFTNDRDLTENILFGTSEDKTTGNVAVVAVKTNSSGETSRTAIHAEPNMPAVTNWDRLHPFTALFDPLILFLEINNVLNIIAEMSSIFIMDDHTYKTINEEVDDNNVVEEDTNINSEGSNNKIIGTHSTEISAEEAGGIGNAIVVIFAYLGMGSNSSDMHITTVEPSSSEGSRMNLATRLNTNLTTELTDAQFHNFPKDIFVREFNLVQYTNTEAMIVLLTNYGILLKTGIDISSLSLYTQEYITNNNEVKLYPNPANDLVSFSDTTINKIEVFDLRGRKILNKTSNTISIKTLSKGIYIIKGTTSKNISVSKKLIKN